MQAAEGKMGRVFMLRLDDGDLLPASIEHFAKEKNIKNGFVLLVGGIGSGQVVVGPRISEQMPPDAVLLPIDGAHEVVGVGVLAPGPEGKITMHMHAAMGRSGKTTTGCIRPGVKTWLVAEAIVYEITGIDAQRVFDKKSGFALLQVK
jgi:Predicted DNA-binding protein with PD1-like DNA-binding motif